MNILILGATGFVGTWITQQLLRAGYHVLCGVRNIEFVRHRFPEATPIRCNFYTDTTIEDWLPRLVNIDIIINCVGIFYHPNSKVMWTLHYETPKALFLAAEKTGVKKIIHLSALNIERYNTEYAKSKKAAEEFLATLSLPHIILKPSFIYGPGAQGGLSLIRSLSALPGIVPLPGQGKQKFQPIYVGDLVQAMDNLILEPTPSLSLAAVSQTPITLKEIMLSLRQWLTIKNAYFITIPLSVIKLFARMGDFFTHSLINTDAIKMLEMDNVTSPAETKNFQTTTGVTPVDFKTGLNKNPATEADKWYSKLVFLRPLLRLSLAFIWLWSALVSAFFYPEAFSFQLLQSADVPASWQSFFLYGASGINALIGLGLLLNYKIKINCLFQLGIILIYTIIITFKLPYQWLEPFGPVVKNLPILVGVLILYAMEKD